MKIPELNNTAEVKFTDVVTEFDGWEETGWCEYEGKRLWFEDPDHTLEYILFEDNTKQKPVAIFNTNLNKYNESYEDRSGYIF